MKNVNVKCPKCGTNLEIKSAEININVPGNISDCGISVEFPASEKKLNKAEEKIEALRNAGVNVDNFFSVRGAKGDYQVMRLDDGEFSVVLDSDPVYAAVRASQTIPERRLFRRWVMAQVFHMMAETDYMTDKPIGFVAALRKKGYKYQWKMLLEELRVQVKLANNDPENFDERNRWFNKDIVLSMATDYLKQLKKFIGKLRIRHCKGIPYVRFNGRDTFTEDLNTKFYKPLEKQIEKIQKSDTPLLLYKAAHLFVYQVKRIYMSNVFEQAKAFKDAYKGAGAFFTMKNLILFHGCIFPKLSQQASIACLKYLVSNSELEGYKLFGVFKEFLTTNNIDIEAKRAEWQK